MNEDERTAHEHKQEQQQQQPVDDQEKKNNITPIDENNIILETNHLVNIPKTQSSSPKFYPQVSLI